jgi:hypothetical protein
MANDLCVGFVAHLHFLSSVCTAAHAISILGRLFHFSQNLKSKYIVQIVEQLFRSRAESLILCDGSDMAETWIILCIGL